MNPVKYSKTNFNSIDKWNLLKVLEIVNGYKRTRISFYV